jgi:hypothetical protein
MQRLLCWRCCPRRRSAAVVASSSGGSAALPGTYGDELGRDRRVDDETGDITLGGLRVHTQSK